ncbi:MAG: methyltransferase dimerization domain-containing protein [Nitrospirales bacterium]
MFQLGYYWETQVLLTAVRMDVFSALEGKRKTLHDMADCLGVHGQTLELLLNALVAMRLLGVGSVAAILTQSSGRL